MTSSTRLHKRHGIDCEEAYSLVMNGITFLVLISLTIIERLEMHVTDVVTTYQYVSLDNDIYIRNPKAHN